MAFGGMFQVRSPLLLARRYDCQPFGDRALVLARHFAIYQPYHARPERCPIVFLSGFLSYPTQTHLGSYSAHTGGQGPGTAISTSAAFDLARVCCCLRLDWAAHQRFGGPELIDDAMHGLAGIVLAGVVVRVGSPPPI